MSVDLEDSIIVELGEVIHARVQRVWQDPSNSQGQPCLLTCCWSIPWLAGGCEQGRHQMTRRCHCGWLAVHLPAAMTWIRVMKTCCDIMVTWRHCILRTAMRANKHPTSTQQCGVRMFFVSFLRVLRELNNSQLHTFGDNAQNEAFFDVQGHTNRWFLLFWLVNSVRKTACC